MKNQSLFILLFAGLFAFFSSCTPDLEESLETQTTTDTNTTVTTTDPTLNIPDGFDFKTHDKVTISIYDSEGDALYEIYSKFKTPDTSLPDSLQVNYDEVKKDNIIYNYKLSGFTQNGVMIKKIQLPTYADKVFIRRKGTEGFTDYVLDVVNNNVNINHSRSASNTVRTAVTIVDSPLTDDIFVNGDARVNGGLNTNGFDLTVTGNLDVNGKTNMASTSTIEANTIEMSGKVNLNGGVIYTDIIEVSGKVNGSGYIYYCTSYDVTGGVNDNQSDSVMQQQCSNDTDGDGVADPDDAYPDNRDMAFQTYSPSPTEYGLLLFEDLWPSYGDYDFNDVAFKYRTLVSTNSDNEAVQIDILCSVKNMAAGFINGMGIELTGVNPGQIQSVTGPIYTQGYISNNANGTEAGQDNAVIIITDNVDNLINEITISITLSSPISTDVLGESPFNPFIIANQIREREIHLPNKPITSLGASSVDNGGVNSDPGGTFISTDGFSWALSFLEDIPLAKETVRINDAYNHFASWATSGGINMNNWYKDLPGYRNTNMLDD